MTARRIFLALAFLAAASAAFGQVTITSTSPLPEAYSGIPYSYTFTATTPVVGGVITWAIRSSQTSALPPGLTLSSGGVLSGTPTQTGTFGFVVVAAEGDFESTGTFSLIVGTPSISINAPFTLTNGLVGQSYSATLSATSTPSGVTWLLGRSQLPPGLTLSSSGVISGIPTTGGAYQPQVIAEITGTSISATQTFSLTIEAGTVAITTASLPVAIAGQPYTANLSGTPTGLTWSVSGSLPSGIALNASSGLLSGSTSALGAYSLTFQASATNYVSATKTLTLTVISPLSMSPATLPPAVQGSAYQTTVTGSGGAPPYTWSAAASTLGLSIGAQTGIITGTPPASGSFLVPVTLTDSDGQVLTQNLNLFVATPLSVATTSLPNGTVGAAYSQSLLAGGGVSPYTWVLAAGSGPLPGGLALSTTGVISGTPTANGTFPFTVKVTDAGGHTATGALSIQVGSGVAPLTITTTSLPGGTVSAAYSQTLAATGGSTPYTWSIVSGTLPAGLNLTAASGVISGTPTASGASNFTVMVTDSASRTATGALTISIAAAAPASLSITTASLPNGQIAVAYSQTLAASGGVAPYKWTIASGTLPAGLSLNSTTGAIAGTPTAAATSTFTIQVTDSTSGTALTAQKAFTISVSSTPPTITTTGSFSATINTAFSQTLAATGGTPPYTWSISSGALPAGLQLNATSGVISGTPTAAGTSNLTVKVTDSQQSTATGSISITVSLPAAPPITIGKIPGTPATQPVVSLSLGSALTTAATGTLSVSFQSAVGGNPTEVQFFTSAGSFTSLTFNVPAGSTTAVFPNTPVLDTGTVAGTITLTATLVTEGGVTITPQPSPVTETIVIPTSAPVIQSVNFTNTGGSLSVVVTGYSTTREMVSGQFTFAPVTGSTLSQSTLTVQLASAFSTWYQSTASNPWGGQFMLTVPFSVAGDAADVAGVSVTLTNTIGTSPAVSPP